MFLLSLFARTRAYSTRELAVKNAAMFLHSSIIGSYRGVQTDMARMFRTAFQREDYQTCCGIWNDIVRMELNSESFKMVKIEQVETDRPFN